MYTRIIYFDGAYYTIIGNSIEELDAKEREIRHYAD